MIGPSILAERPTISGEAALVDGSKGQCCQNTNEEADSAFDLSETFSSSPTLGAECSRQRLRRRRMTAAKVLRGHSPRTASGDAKEQLRGKWYPVSACATVPRSGGMSLDVRASGRVDSHGIMRCGSVWTCVECSQRVATHRAIEIKAMIERAREKGHRVEMVTFTLPHDLSLSADDAMGRLKEALRRFSADGTAARTLKGVGYVGQVRAIEVTYGHVSGWHFHAHAVIVLEAGDDGEAKDDFARSLALKKALYPVWKRAAHASGAGTPNFRHGFDVRVVWSANDYIAKLPEAASAKAEAGKGRWGAEAELSKAYMKEGRKSSRTPWEILDSASDNPADAQLFRDYARATWGRSQIEWSKGARDLRKLFLDGADAKTDEVLAYEDPEWVFDDEESEEHEAGQENLIVERVQIASADAWRARRENFGGLDRAVTAMEWGGALRLSDALRDEGWALTKVKESGHSTAIREDRAGRVRECFIFEPEEWVATWPGSA